MDTDHSLQAVINLVRSERPVIDLLLGTGDLSDQGALAYVPAPASVLRPPDRRQLLAARQP